MNYLRLPLASTGTQQGAKLYESLASGFKDKSLKFKTRLNQFWNSEQKHSSPVTTPTR